MTTTSKWAGVTLAAMIAAGLWVSRRSEIEHVSGPVLPPGKVVPQIAMTWDAATLLAPDGTLWAWGGVQFGLEGSFSSHTVTPVPLRVGRDSDWARVGISWNHTVALKQDGSLWGWGYNPEGALTTTPSNRVANPQRIGTGNDWADVSSGASHVMALKRDGSLWTWGQNRYGQIGDGTTNNYFVPFQVTTNREWKSIAAGFFNSYAIAGDGTIWGWGLCGSGVGRGPDDHVPVRLDPGSNWVAISSADYQMVAVRGDGSLWIHGQNASVTVPTGPTARTTRLFQIGSATNWVAGWAGQRGVMARKQDGSWWVSGAGPAVAYLGEGPVSGDGSGMRRMADGFDPLALGVGFGTAAILTRDGVLWSAGQRLGEPGRMTLLNRMQGLVALISGSRSNPQPSPVVDRVLRRIWQLPVPSTNSPTPVIR